MVPKVTKRMVQQKVKFMLLGGMALGLLTSTVWADDYLYRYENDKGVSVINHMIPPEFAQKGYQILSKNGQLIRTVEAAPTDGDVAQENADRMLREKFSILRRRYSTLDDIESAKRRRLTSIETNISILRGNISNIKTRIENLLSQAADTERAGRTVSANLLRQLKDSKAELSVTEAALAKRIAEYDEVAARFEKDKDTFAAGLQLNQTNTIN